MLQRLVWECARLTNSRIRGLHSKETVCLAPGRNERSLVVVTEIQLGEMTWRDGSVRACGVVGP